SADRGGAPELADPLGVLGLVVGPELGARQRPAGGDQPPGRRPARGPWGGRGRRGNPGRSGLGPSWAAGRGGGRRGGRRGGNDRGGDGRSRLLRGPPRRS